MRVPRALIPVILLLAVGSAGCYQLEDGGAMRGEPAPEFILTSLENETVGTNASQGRVLFIDFMGANCGSCRASMKELVPLEQAFGDKVDFVSIDVGSYFPALGGKNADDLRGFRDHYNATWPFALDTLEQNTATRYTVLGLPTAVVVDAEGVVSCREGGYSPGSYDHWARWINHTLENGYDPAFGC